MTPRRTYIAIDLKSFYASVECVERKLDLFTDYEALERERRQEQEAIDKERRLMETTLRLKKRFGKNSLLKGMNFNDGATQRERNNQIGGHKA